MDESVKSNSVVIADNNIKYIIKTTSCKTCEFTPPCRLCTWISKNDIDDIYCETEEFLPKNRKDFIKDKTKWAKKKGIKLNKKREKRINKGNNDNIMTI